MEKQEKTIEISLHVYEDFLKQMEQIAELKQQVEWLTEQFRLAKRKQFGTSSKQTDNGQLCLFNEAEQTADLTAPEPEIAEVKAHYRRKTRVGVRTKSWTFTQLNQDSAYTQRDLNNPVKL